MERDSSDINAGDGMFLACPTTGQWRALMFTAPPRKAYQSPGSGKKPLYSHVTARKLEGFEHEKLRRIELVSSTRFTCFRSCGAVMAKLIILRLGRHLMMSEMHSTSISGCPISRSTRSSRLVHQPRGQSSSEVRPLWQDLIKTSRRADNDLPLPRKMLS